MANNAPNTAPFVSILNLNGQSYTIADAWARAEIADIETAIAGGVHFRGVTTTEIADGDNVKDLTVNGETYAAAKQVNGDLFIYNNGTKNLEFIVSGGKYSELGSTGTLGAMAYADTASGTVDLSGNISVSGVSRVTGIGSVLVTTTTASVDTSSTETAAAASLTLSDITVPTLSVTSTTASYDSITTSYVTDTATLTITSVTATFVTGVTATPGTTEVSAPTATLAVTYDKISASGTFLASASLTGTLDTTDSAPTVTVTPVTVTVTPDGD